ncbi:MAG: hypothetical protein D3926_00345 [Desulfobacteraceae bacterium]|nr:MAG: hypothetical protein D3926_00345 [Desulfobacteraceae bacterium]
MGDFSLRLSRIPGLLLCLLLAMGCDSYEDLLSTDERVWLEQHDSEIRVTPDPAFPPIDFYDETGVYQGISAEYFGLIESRLDLKFTFLKTQSWATALEDIKAKSTDVIVPTQRTRERSKYLLFTDPYIEIPTVIITTLGNTHLKTMDLLKGKRVAVVKAHAIVEQFIRPNYPHLDLVEVKNIKSGLLEVSFNEVDAMLAELPTATYTIEKMGITNLRISGSTPYKYDLAMASRKDLPVLNSILQKGLAAISLKEREAIQKKWIRLSWEPFYKNRNFQIITSVSLCIILFVIFWNLILKREIDQRKRAEAMLRESETKFRNIIEASPMGIHLYRFESGGELIFRGANQSADRILGVDHQQFTGRTIEEAFPFLVETNIPGRYKELCEQGGIWVQEQVDFEDHRIKGAFEVHAFQTARNEMAAMFIDVKERKIAERERERLINDLQNALMEIKTLSGLLPICASCKKIRDDQGYWNQIESYIKQHSDAEFSHGLCPGCSDQLYGDQGWYIKMKQDKGIK